MKEPLFDIAGVKDALISADTLESDAATDEQISDFVFAKVGKKCQDVFDKIDLTKTTHYVTAGLWSNYELLEFLLSKTGPADVYIATWSMSQESAVRLVRMLEARIITKLVGVLDFRTKNRNPAAFQLAQQIFSELRLGSCHAKVTVIKNKSFNICINGSANYTNNPRIESGVISTSISVANFHAAWITKLLHKSNAFE